jgi:hypothetical protein
MVRVTLLASPCGTIVNSAVLWPSNGLKKSSLITTFDAAEELKHFNPGGPDILIAVPGMDRACPRLAPL